MKTKSKGIWIPEAILRNVELTLMEKLFFIKISSLDRDSGCYASNAYFAEYFGLSKSRCSIIIKNLKDKGYISIKYFYEDGKKNIERRVIKIIDFIDEFVGLNKFEDNSCEDSEIEALEIEKEVEELLESSENINLKLNNNVKKRESKKEIYEEIVGYLNLKCKTNYKYTSKKTQRAINARISEGYAIDDFKNVIDKKNEEWNSSSMKIYLRPETLFGGKFERYLNEEIKDKKDHFNNIYLKGGQGYGMQFKNVRNSRKNEEIKNGGRFTNTELSKEELEWAAREMF